MLDSLRHQMMFQGPLSGQIQSHEGGIYIARLINEYGEIVEQYQHHFPSMICAREWLEKHGAKSIELETSSAYLEMINN